MMKKSALVFACAVLCAASQAQDNVKWGSAPQPVKARMAVEGMAAFYDADAVENKGGVHAFNLYRTATSSPNDDMGRYMINCETREFVSTVNGQTTQPVKILAGESLYSLGKKLCGWDQKGMFKKLMDAAGG